MDMNLNLCLLIESIDELEELNKTELNKINGGGFWADIFYAIGYYNGEKVAYYQATGIDPGLMMVSQ